MLSNVGDSQFREAIIPMQQIVNSIAANQEMLHFAAHIKCTEQVQTAAADAHATVRRGETASHGG